MLILRVLSALVGIPIVLSAVFFGGYWYALFILLVVNIGIYEYCILLKANNMKPRTMLCIIGVTLITAAIFWERIDLVYPLLMILFFMLYIGSLFMMEERSIHDSALCFWGVVYIGGLGGFMLMLRMLENGAIYTFIMLAGVWIHDTIAYFIGIKWGYRKFAPQISPNKSVEGSLSGIIVTIFIFFSLSIMAPGFLPLAPVQSIILALGISVFAQLGDLFESALKRQLNVKDSGGIIPGHGGILDRFDSLFLTAPLVYCFFLLIS